MIWTRARSVLRWLPAAHLSACGPDAGQVALEGSEAGSGSVTAAADNEATGATASPDLPDGCAPLPECLTVVADGASVCWARVLEGHGRISRMALRGDEVLSAGRWWHAADDAPATFVVGVSFAGDVVALLSDDAMRGHAIAADPRGGFFVAGEGAPGTAHWLRRYDAHATLAWTADVDALDFPFSALLPLSDGRIWGAGAGLRLPDAYSPTYVGLFDPFGELLMEDAYGTDIVDGSGVGSSGRTIAGAEDGSVRVLGIVTDGSTWFAQLDETGLIGYDVIDVPTYWARFDAFASDPDRVYFVGYTGGAGLVVAMTTTLEPIWVRTVGESSELAPALGDVQLLSDGELVVTGTVPAAGASELDAWIGRVTTDGDIAASLIVRGAARGLDSVDRVVVLPSGDVMVSGVVGCATDEDGDVIRQPWFARVVF